MRGPVGVLVVILIVFFAGMQVFVLPPDGWVPLRSRGSFAALTRAATPTPDRDPSATAR